MINVYIFKIKSIIVHPRNQKHYTVNNMKHHFKHTSTVFFAICSLILSIGIHHTIAQPSNAKMYCWLGYNAAGPIADKNFQKFFLRAVKLENTTIDITPSKKKILDAIKDADIIYTNTHSGYPKKEPYRMILQTGELGSDNGELEALDISLLMNKHSKLPTLIVINGCNTLAEHPNGRVLKIHEAFKIKADTKGRAYIGFDKSVPGLRGDEFFRVFFAHWTNNTSGKYPTLEEARTRAIQTFNNLPSGDNVKQQPYTMKTDAEIGEAMQIVGDKELSFDKIIDK